MRPVGVDLVDWRLLPEVPSQERSGPLVQLDSRRLQVRCTLPDVLVEPACERRGDRLRRAGLYEPHRGKPAVHLVRQAAEPRRELSVRCRVRVAARNQRLDSPLEFAGRCQATLAERDLLSIAVSVAELNRPAGQLTTADFE